MLSSLDLASITKTIQNFSPLAVFIVIAGYTLGQIISAYKWYQIVKAAGIHRSFREALTAYFTAMFVNVFGLGLVGGDLTRGLLMSGKTESGESSRSTALATVIADRAHGLAVLALIGTLAVFLFAIPSLTLSWKIFLSFIALVLTVSWFYGPALLLWGARHLTHPKLEGLRNIIEKIFLAFPSGKTELLQITALSLCFHLLQIALHGVMAWGIGKSIPLPLLLAAIPFINILCSLPISWQGLGVRETAYVFFLSAGSTLTKEEALALGAIWFIAVTVNGAIGGIVCVFSGNYERVKSFKKLTLKKGKSDEDQSSKPKTAAENGSSMTCTGT